METTYLLLFCVIVNLYQVKSETLPNVLPSLEECGISDGGKASNGPDAGITEFPWSALIKYSKNNRFACGGTLINNRYVLTSAHCVTGTALKSLGPAISVRLGEWNYETDPDCVGGTDNICKHNTTTDYEVEKVIAHNLYNSESMDKTNDIALIKLNRTVQYTDYIKPVCLPAQDDGYKAGERLTLVGWGKSPTDNKENPIKQKVVVPVLSESECALQYKATKITLQSSQLCAGGEKGVNTCIAYGGSPLLGTRHNGHYFLEGVVSFGPRCGTQAWADVYTKVSKYRNWVEDTIKD